MKFNEDFLKFGVQVLHHFAKGVYAKETRIPAGVALEQHRHAFDHLSILAKGKVRIEFKERVRRYEAPACILIRSGLIHRVVAVEDAVWYCVNATDETEPEKADRSLVENRTA